jgi:anti-anti-sigma factor
MNAFRVHVEQRPGWTVAHLQGNASCTGVGPMREALADLLSDRHPAVVLDLSELTFINSLALGVLVEFRRDVQAYGGQLRLAGASAQIAEVFRKTRLVELFPMFDTAEHAVEQS